uniref:Uncharacterized protein n=1 Tax=Anguilla anguilla TaxID=7936 RepID=A0A0E9P7K2_ANGAN
MSTATDTAVWIERILDGTKKNSTVL